VEELRIVLPPGVSAKNISLECIHVTSRGGQTIYTFHYPAWRVLPIGTHERYLQYNSAINAWRTLMIVTEEVASESKREESDNHRV
jgi:hypothetical protein